jgi:Glu-tRNA(Gln) amidotransferase subunit E-like FAD-binding protein
MSKTEKTYTTKQVMAEIKKESKKKHPTVNAHLKKYLQEIVNKEIGKEYRADAMKILLKAKRHEVAEFLITHHSDGTKVGLCCLALDFIKDRLIEDKEIGKNSIKHFGNNF